jgi:hypothetical protein
VPHKTVRQTGDETGGLILFFFFVNAGEPGSIGYCIIIIDIMVQKK